MSKGTRQKQVNSPPTALTVARPSVELGPATLQVFADVLSASQISQAQLITFLEARGLIGNYRLVVTAARVVPVEAQENRA